jgi:hypothetical protein
LKGIFADDFHPMEITHDLLSGAFDRGKGIGTLKLTKQARTWKLRHKGPDFFRVEPGDRLAAFLTTFDLSASAAGHLVSTLKGYERRTARRILRNCILHRLADLEASTKAKAPKQFSP